MNFKLWIIKGNAALLFESIDSERADDQQIDL